MSDHAVDIVDVSHLNHLTHFRQTITEVDFTEFLSVDYSVCSVFFYFTVCVIFFL